MSSDHTKKAVFKDATISSCRPTSSQNFALQAQLKSFLDGQPTRTRWTDQPKTSEQPKTSFEEHDNSPGCSYVGQHRISENLPSGAPSQKNRPTMPNMSQDRNYNPPFKRINPLERYFTSRDGCLPKNARNANERQIRSVKDLKVGSAQPEPQVMPPRRSQGQAPVLEEEPTSFIKHQEKKSKTISLPEVIKHTGQPALTSVESEHHSRSSSDDLFKFGSTSMSSASAEQRKPKKNAYEYWLMQDIKPLVGSTTSSSSANQQYQNKTCISNEQTIAKLCDQLGALELGPTRPSVEGLKSSSCNERNRSVIQTTGSGSLSVYYPESTNSSLTRTDTSSYVAEYQFAKISGRIACTFDKFSIFDMNGLPELDDWCEMYQTKRSDLCQSMRAKMLGLKDTDLELQIGKSYFTVHKIVLQACSTFFAQRWHLDKIVLPECKVKSIVFMSIYQWMLTIGIHLSYKSMLDTYTALKFLGIPRLLSEVWTCIDDESVYKEDTAFTTYQEARSHGVDNVVVVMLPRIAKFFLTLVASLDFVKLNIEDLCTILSSNIIHVNTEQEVFLAAIRWLEGDWQQRKAEVVRVMECVRFNLLPHPFNVWLTKLAAEKTGDVLSQVASNEIIRQWTKKSVAFNTIHVLYLGDLKGYLESLIKNKVIPPRTRCFIYDPLSSYHCEWEEPINGFVDYNEFCRYLRALRDKEPAYFEGLLSRDAASEAEYVAGHVNGVDCTSTASTVDRSQNSLASFYSTDSFGP